MTAQQSPNLVPSSLIRIRCFLNRRGMKVKPWLGPEAVLDAFYAALRLQCQSESFWTELEDLLRVLATDMNRRISSRGWIVQNELLESEQHAELLRQIRAALHNNSQSARSIHSLASMLPSRAGALLLMMAAALAVGCVEQVSTVDASGGTSGLATGGTSSQSGTGARATGGSSGDTRAEAGRGGGGIRISTDVITLPKASCSPESNSGLDTAKFAACNPELVSALIPHDIHADSGKQLLECACVLNDAWQTGLAKLFAGQDCQQILSYFGDCGLDEFCRTNPASFPAEFDADTLFENCMTLLYLGVRAD
jgi:hypothetical protein